MLCPSHARAKAKGLHGRRAHVCRAWLNGPTTPNNPGRNWNSTSSGLPLLFYRSKPSRPCTTKPAVSVFLTIVLTRDLQGQRPDQMFYCTNLDWDARQILSTYACRWAIECTFENCKQFLGLEDPANRLPLAVERTAPMALLLYSLVVVWFHLVGHHFLRFPYRPWYRSKQEPSFADLLTTLRRVSCEEKTQTLLSNRCRLKTWLTQITELLSRVG